MKIIKFILALFFLVSTFKTVYCQVDCNCKYDFERTKQGWVVETDPSTLGAKSVNKSTIKPYCGKSSIQVTLNLSKEIEGHSQGEIRVDLRTHAPGDEIGPLNLDDKIITVYIYFPKEYEGLSHCPNGFQLFAKTVIKHKNRKDEWKSLYSSWYNATGLSEDWMRIRFKITNNPPDDYYIENGFDPTNVSFLGVKFGLGGEAPSNIKFEGDIFVDCVSW